MGTTISATRLTSPGTEPVTPERLPRRDYLVLPLLSLLTIAGLFGLSEVIARAVWPQVDQDSCFVNDPIAGYGFRPNCTSRMKSAEGPWTTNRYNECGYRTAASCGPKPAGTLRIALLGSSVAEGMFVPYEETFAIRTAAALTRSLGRRVEMQNLGVFDSSPLYVYRRLPETMSLKPDAVVFVLSPWDLEQKMDPTLLKERNSSTASFSRPAATAQIGLYKRAQFFLLRSRSVLVAQHYLFSNTDTYLRLYLAYGDKADFLRVPLTEAWQKRFADLHILIRDMAERLRQKDIALVLAAVPSRAEAALLSESFHHAKASEKSGIDASAFGREVGRMAEQEHVVNVDLMSAFGRLPHSERLFYTVDGHLTAEGHAVVAQAMTNSLQPLFESAEAKQ